MSRVFLFLILLSSFEIALGQNPRVPSQMRFADINLKINDPARQEIQEFVDELVKSPTYFGKKVERARLYFPIIERILAEENVPDEFKYLVIQESALTSDAVSSSNAVGYWQFKDFTAIEMGLRVDNHIDERMNIVASTRAAAKYFKKNNFYFDNWLYALQAYQMGAGAAMKAVGDKDNGKKTMAITKKTYWYVMKYLAHNIAYSNALERNVASEKRLLEYTRGKAKSLQTISRELDIEESTLTDYNKWLKRGKIPEDRTYVVIVPVENDLGIPDNIVASLDDRGVEKPKTSNYLGIEDPDRFPEISDKKRMFKKKPVYVNINGIPGIVGKSSQTPESLSELAGISEQKFRDYNEILPHQVIEEDQVYYFHKKKSKAKVHYHTVQYKESLWSISQKYGVKVSKLIKKNRLKEAEDIAPGMVLWLRYIRPANEDIAYKEVQKPEVLIVNESLPEQPSVKEPVVAKPLIETVSITESKPDSLIESENIEQKEIWHFVKARETLYGIAMIYDVGVMEIVEWNNLKIEDGLRIDQRLSIWVNESFDTSVIYPDSTTSSAVALDVDTDEADGYIEYKVEAGDTLYAIARKYSVTVADIKLWNDKSDTSVSVGESLKIKK